MYKIYLTIFCCLHVALYGAPNVLVSHGFGATAFGTIGVIWPLMPTDNVSDCSKDGTLLVQDQLGGWKEFILSQATSLSSWDLNLKYLLNNNKVVAPEYGDNGLLANSSLGQGADVEKLQEAATFFNEKGFFAIGHSRGAAALINYIAKYNPSTLQGLVLFACPASISAVVSENFFGNFLGSESLAHALLSCIAKYPLSAQSSEIALQNIENKDLPVLILHRKDDRVINVEHSVRLYQSFVDAGFRNVYLKIIDKGGHSDFFVHGSDAEIINLFYKAYGTKSIDLKEFSELQRKIQDLSNSTVKYRYKYFTVSNFVALSIVCGICYVLYQNLIKQSDKSEQIADKFMVEKDELEKSKQL